MSCSGNSVVLVAADGGGYSRRWRRSSRGAGWPRRRRVRAELMPEEIAVVAARGNRESEQLAKYYMKERGIPAENLCLVDMPREEVCPRDKWTWAIRPEIRKWLDEHDPDKKLRCLVTVWGVPLKIGAGGGRPPSG